MAKRMSMDAYIWRTILDEDRLSHDHMQPFTVIYVEPSEGLEIWQFFQCHADNDDHAEEQCRDAYPTCKVLWVNTGHGPQSQTMS